MPEYRKFVFRYFAGKIIMRQLIKVEVLVTRRSIALSTQEIIEG
jgi:hypothetical protein